MCQRQTAPLLYELLDREEVERQTFQPLSLYNFEPELYELKIADDTQRL